MSPTQCFTNATFQVLSCLYDNLGKHNVSHVTQREISKDVDLCLSFVNEKIQELVKHGYIAVDKEHRGRYILTDVAIKTVELLRQADEMYYFNVR
jgi:predicted transcriptional regulator